MRMWLRIPCSESRASFAISFVTRLLKVNYLSQAAVLKRKGWGEGSNTPSGVSRWKQLSSASLIRPFLPMLGISALTLGGMSVLTVVDVWLAWFPLQSWWRSAPLGYSLGMSLGSWHETGKRKRRCPCNGLLSLRWSRWWRGCKLMAPLVSCFHGISITPVPGDV